MNETRRLWIILGAVIFSTLFVLGWFGRELYRKVPPIPLEVRIESGERLMNIINDLIDMFPASPAFLGKL